MDFVRRFYLEAKTFELLVVEGASVLRLEERRKGLSCVAFLELMYTTWLKSMMEELVCISVKNEFIKSFSEESKVFIAQRRYNRFGWFLEVVVYLVEWPERTHHDP
jgi:hypothetical protein